MSATTTSQRLPIVAGVIGSVLEWYDFLLFAFFAPIIGPIFFHTDSQFVALLLTFTVFALGFLVRPIGALLFGYIGDRYGRRQALIYSITVITIPTVLIGILPGYAVIGILAPLILTLIRLLQGLAVSGEIASSAVFMIEHSKPNQHAFAGSLTMSSAIFGIVSGAIIALLFSIFMPKPILESWGWRIPFLISGVFGVVGFFIRKRAVESPEFQNLKQVHRTPLKLLFTVYPKLLLRGIGLTVVVAIGNYFLITYFSTYLELQKMPMVHAMLLTVISLMFLVVFILIAGHLADRFGLKKLYLTGVIFLFLAAFPLFWLITHHTFWHALIGEVLFAIILSFTSGLVLSALATLFPTEIRNTSMSLAYNIAQAIFGGSASMVALSLVSITKSNMAPAWYLMAGAFLSFLAVFFMKSNAIPVKPE
jgi:proline/betaine transport protein TphA